MMQLRQFIGGFARLGGLVVIALTTVARLAAAQVNAERFKPAVTHDGWVTSEGSDVRPTADPFEFGFLVNYGYRPLVITDANSNYSRSVVSGRLGMDLQGSVTLFKPFAVGLESAGVSLPIGVL